MKPQDIDKAIRKVGTTRLPDDGWGQTITLNKEVSHPNLPSLSSFHCQYDYEFVIRTRTMSGEWSPEVDKIAASTIKKELYGDLVRKLSMLCHVVEYEGRDEVKRLIDELYKEYAA